MNASVEAIRPSSPLAKEAAKGSDSPTKPTFRSQRPEASLEADKIRPTSPRSANLGESFTSHQRSPRSIGERPTSIAREITFNKADNVEARIRQATALKVDKTRQFVLLWGYCFILTLDGGGVRGYSQLLILKALMDKVEAIERSKPSPNGKKVESSFDPIPWTDVPTTSAETIRKPKSTAISASSSSRSMIPSNGALNGNGKEKEQGPKGEKSRFYPHHYFDWIAGTSTGGLNAIMLSRLRMSVDDCLKEYADLAKQVFGKSRWASYRFTPFFWPCAKYNKKTLEKIVDKVVQDNLRKQEGDCFAMNPNMCRTIVYAWGHNKGTGHDVPVSFRSYAHHQQRVKVVDETNGNKTSNPIEKAGPADSCLIWQAARATSAAPSYFNSIQIGQMEYIDGGFGLNNPSQKVFHEVSQVHRNIHEANALTVSIGTGISRFSRSKPGFLRRPLGWLNGAKKVSTDCEQHHQSMIQETVSGKRHRYHRFNVPEQATEDEAPKISVIGQLFKTLKTIFGQDIQPLDRGLGKIKLDEWKERGIWRKESTKEEIYRVTQAYLQDSDVDKELDAIALSLVLQRRARSETPRWKAYALGIRYECPMISERCPEATFAEEGDLREHLIRDHRVGEGLPENSKEKKLKQFVNAGEYYEYHH